MLFRSCRHQALCAHFDETIEPCRVACDACLGLNLDDVMPRRPAQPATTRRITPSWQTADTDLFDRLRALRRELADKDSVPAYIVFSDAVLREIAQRKPRTSQELLNIPGIGQRKLARYGAAILEFLSASS